MKKSFIPIAVLMVIIIYIAVSSSKDHPDKVTPTFSWRFEKAETNNLDGLPQTNVHLVADVNGKQLDRLLDTVDGSCSELEGEKHEGVISNTGKVQCYSAGLGQEYRIIQGENAYHVERKLFEEALPDTTPPSYDWEVIEEISL